MKKLLFIAATAAVALSSCSSDDLATGGEGSAVNDGSIRFDAYNARATRAAISDNNSLKINGFGVYAFEQGSTAWNIYRASNSYPNFMYNQLVNCDVASVQLAASIPAKEFRAISNSDLKGKYSGNTASGNYTGSTTIDKAGIDALIAAGLTAGDYVGTSATVTFKPTLTPAEYNGLIASPGTVRGYYDDKTSTTGKYELNSSASCADLAAYVGLDATERAIAVQSVTASTVSTITPEKYEKLNPASLAAVQALFTEGSASDAPMWNANSNTLTATDYAALTTSLDRSLATGVTLTNPANGFEYSPVKYYSNNEGANHSFFAYAPYNKSVKSVFTGNGPAIRYTAGEDYDLLWALPTTDKKKADIDERIVFNFKHALSKVSFKASTFVDKVHPESSAHNPSAVAENTTVTLRSIKFVGNVPSKAVLSLADGSWTIEQSMEKVYEFCTPEGITFDQNKAGEVVVSTDHMVIPTDAANKVKIEVTYDVTTVDPSNPQNGHSVTNTVESEEDFDLVQGMAYTFCLDLGLTSVKFDASVASWDEVTPNIEVDLPNNHKFHATTAADVTRTPNTLSSTTFLGEFTQDVYAGGTAVGQLYYNTNTKTMMYLNAISPVNSWVTYTVPTLFWDNGSEKYYDVDGTAGGTKILNTQIVKNGSDYYYRDNTTAMAAPISVASLNVNSEGKIEVTEGVWTAPIDNQLYEYNGNLYQWR